jgi:serine/threonine protein phosphatase PrpC
MHLRSFGLSDIGFHRMNNEDVWSSLPEIGFFALADGMGGHKGGEVAAKEAIQTLTTSAKEIKNRSCMELVIEMRHAIEKANRWIYQLAQQSEDLCGMGTTLCCLFWTDEFIVYAHIGDSRIYRMRKKKLELLTKDHTLLTKWHAADEFAGKCETPFPYKNVITRALGTAQKSKPEIKVAPHEPEDLYFLSSDGLHDVLELDEMERLINASEDLEISCKNLIELAKFKGSSDNITLLMIQSGQKSDKSADLF